MGWDSCYLDLFDESTMTLECAVAYDTFDGTVTELDRSEVEHILSNKEQDAIQRTARLILREAPDSPSHGLRPFGNKSQLSASLIFVPCRAKEGITGILSVQSYTRNAYNEDDLQTAQALADHCAGALQRIRAQENLEASETRFRTVVEGLGEGIMITDLEDQVLYVNTRMAEMTGYEKKEMIGRPEYELIQDESDWQNARSRVQARERGESERYELRMKRKDGSRFWADVCATPYRDPGGRVIGTLGCASDIDARKQAEKNLRTSEQRLRQSQKMEAIGQLAAGIAHDFNNVMTIIKVHAELLKEEPAITGQTLDSIHDIADSAQRAIALTKQLLAFSRKQTMSLSVTDLNYELNQLTKVLKSILGEQIKLETKLSKRQAVVNVDVGMIGQIVTNLVMNARDAMPGGGVLTIGTSLVPNSSEPNPSEVKMVCLTVSDTGNGIPKNLQSRIFDPFFSTKDVGKGTGLGLSTVYGLVEQLGGTIDVDSKPGSGATFSVHLPLCTASASPAKSPSDASHAPIARTEITVLAVEDEPALRQVMRTVLQRQGYEVLLAEDAIEALDIWSRHSDSISLVLTDLVMPGEKSGFDLSQLIEKKRPDVPVVFASGYGVETHADNGLLKEGYNFLPKPFNSAALSEIVAHRLKREIVNQ